MDFLFDTGASISVVHPADAGRIPINFARDFANGHIVNVEGVGGIIREYSEPTFVLLRHDDGVVDRVHIQMSFAPATNYNQDFPSLLGMDVIRHYKFTYHLADNLVSLE